MERWQSLRLAVLFYFLFKGEGKGRGKVDGGGRGKKSLQSSIQTVHKDVYFILNLDTARNANKKA